jgi:hypothetical protein
VVTAMEDLELYLSVAGTIIGLLITTITFLSKFITNLKARKKLENLLSFTNAIQGFIKEAEQFVHYTGAEKKAYVMTSVEQIALNKKVKLNIEAVSAKIDELVDLTKKVNIRSSSTMSSKEKSSKELMELRK